MASYRITWTETSSHEVELADHELAQLYGLTPATMEGYDLTDGEGLDDALAEYSDQGFMFLYRNDIEVEQIDPMPPRRPTDPDALLDNLRQRLGLAPANDDPAQTG
jgi:hypothetical protein